MGLRLITPPAAELLSLEETKLHLRQDGQADDVLISSLVRTAREHVEALTRRALLPQTWELSLDHWPSHELRLPMPPLRAVNSISYRLRDGTEVALDETEYVIDTGSAVGRVAPAPGTIWPTARLYPLGGVKVRFEAGYDQVPEAIKQSMLLLIGHWYQNREAINIGNVVNSLPFAVDALLWPFKVW